MKKLNLAIIGQGRSGKNIHGIYLSSERNNIFNVKYVVEADEQRRNLAKETYGCEVFADYKSLLDKDDIDLVVNATFSEFHYPITKDLLAHKKNVLVEKPFARTRYECDDLIKTAKDNNVLLTVFQQSLVAPFYTRAKQILEEGLIGEPKIINIRYNGFSRRWDWQTLQKKVAGNVYNTGPHPLGMAMDLLGFDKDIKLEFSYLDRALASGDGEDIAKFILTAPGKPVADIEINNTDAYSDYNLKIQGTRGTIKCTPGRIIGKYIVEGENPEQPVIEGFLKDENNAPIYCNENLITHEIDETITGSVFIDSVAYIYENIYKVLTENAELIVKPEQIARLIGFIEQAHVENPLPLIY